VGDGFLGSNNQGGEMKRVFVALIAALFTVALGSVGSASASTAQTFHFRFNGTFAEAEWFASTATTATDTYINPSRTTNGQQQLFIDQFTANYDSNGNFVGATDTSAFVTSGFSFTINSKTFDTAAVNGTGIPAQTCTFDANFNLTGCSDTTIDASASWTGQGSVTRSVFGDHFHTFGFTETDHFSGTNRIATATGTIGGLTLTIADNAFADMGTTHSGSVDICLGGTC
jgi:hypothetical protein